MQITHTKFKFRHQIQIHDTKFKFHTPDSSEFEFGVSDGNLVSEFEFVLSEFDSGVGDLTLV